MEDEGVGVSASENDPYILMEQVLDSLKLLDYESNFVKKKGMSISKVHFAQPSQNQSEQFIQF